MSTPTTLLDLPVEVLLLILPHLDAESFLNFTSTCRALHDRTFLNESSYWSSLVRHDFRVPNQPVAANDGARWHKLYKRLRTQSRVFTWGNNEKACLGHSHVSNTSPTALVLRNGVMVPVMPGRRRNHIAWPGEMQGTAAIGVVSDLQCGGWSTTLLSAKGALYTVGQIDGSRGNQTLCEFPASLCYPRGFVHPRERYDSTTAIRQFSAGRAHILGISDSGRLWSWYNIGRPGVTIKFLLHDTVENGKERGPGVVQKVVAGWGKSAALIGGVGICVWDPIYMHGGDGDHSDAALVMQSLTVPRTSYSPTAVHDAETQDLAEHVGEVKEFILLENNTVLFSTSLGKVFACRIQWTDHEQSADEPIDLTPYIISQLNPSPEETTFITSVQGSFRSFAIFLQSGAVLTSDLNRIMSILSARHSPSPRLFTRIPALQNNNVISIAFGDYHFHALHSTGHITSYGYEPQMCGALGLGGAGNPEARLRGIRNHGMPPDGRLVPHAYTSGRQVWFETEKQHWIQYITSGGVDEAEAAARMRMALGSPAVACQGELSEWIEQEGRDWETKFNAHTDDDDGLCAYFALSVTAAGWHSGALVLVNEDLAARVRAQVEMTPEPAPQTESNTDDDDDDDDASSTTSTTVSSVSTSSDHPPRSWTSYITDTARWFLGIPSSNHPSAPTNIRRSTIAPYLDSEYTTNYGAHTRDGVPYIWARDPFPRLQLTDGTEMPGTVPLNTWRYGRPDFKLDEKLW